MHGWTVDRWIQLVGTLAGVGSFVVAVIALRRGRQQGQPAGSPPAYPTAVAPAIRRPTATLAGIVFFVISLVLCGSALVSCAQDIGVPIVGGYCADGSPTIPADRRSTYCGYDSDCYNDGCHHV